MIMTSEALRAIADYARKAYPDEGCGALIGSDGTVTEVLTLPNTTNEGARRRFRIRPEDYRRAEAHADAARKELMGFYHSHPDHPARPSAYDLEYAWPNLIYVIVSVDSERTGELTAWRLAENRSRFEPHELDTTR